MLHFTREITKEEYDRAKVKNVVPKDIANKYIGVEFWCGYGVYGMGVEEKDGKYQLWFDTGESCD